MITAVIVSCNQESLLKQHLSAYVKAIETISGQLVIIDDGSTDKTKDYVTTHFPDIRYMRTLYEDGYCKAFNKALPLIDTPYILCIDPSISLSAVSLSNVIQNMKTTQAFMLSFPTYSGKSKHPSYALKRKGFSCELTSNIPEPHLCFISELMCFNAKRLQAFGGLQTHYFHPVFAWFDLITSARCQGQQTG